MKGYFYTGEGIDIPKEPVKLERDLKSSIEPALSMFETNNIKLKKKSVTWALLSLTVKIKVLVKPKKKDESEEDDKPNYKTIALNGRLLICD